MDILIENNTLNQNNNLRILNNNNDIIDSDDDYLNLFTDNYNIDIDSNNNSNNYNNSNNDNQLLTDSIISNSSNNSSTSDFLCRICYDRVEYPKIYCKCKGDTSYIHKECLLKWLSVKGLSEYRYIENEGTINEKVIYEYKYLCDVCHTPYNYTSKDNTTFYSSIMTIVNVFAILLIIFSIFILNYTHQNHYVLLIYLWIILIIIPYILKKINTYIENKKKILINIYEIDDNNIENLSNDNTINNNEINNNGLNNDGLNNNGLNNDGLNNNEINNNGLNNNGLNNNGINNDISIYENDNIYENDSNDSYTSLL